jgi:hypothetical protein
MPNVVDSRADFFAGRDPRRPTVAQFVSGDQETCKIRPSGTFPTSDRSPSIGVMDQETGAAAGADLHGACVEAANRLADASATDVIAWAVADAARAPEPAQRVAVVLTQIAYLHRRPY